MTGLHTYTHSGTQLCAETPPPPHTFHLAVAHITDRMLTHLYSSGVKILLRRRAHTPWIHWPTSLLHTHLHTLGVHPVLLNRVRMFHKSGPACRGYASVRCRNCVCAWVLESFTLTAIEKTYTHIHAADGACSLITVVSKESPWQWQNETTACGRGGVWECVCICLCVSYRPRSGLFPQKGRYSPHANQRTKFETELNPSGPTLLTFITRGQSQASRWQAGRWHHP